MAAKTETIELSVDAFDTDYKRQLTWETLGVGILKCAEAHASRRGFGIYNVNGENHTWVLARLVIELNNTPKVYDEYKISTWVESIYRIFSNRCFSITGADGTPYGYARSTWSLISYSSRKALDLNDLKGMMSEYVSPEIECPITDYSGARLGGNAQQVMTYKVKYSDIDLNGHTNSMKYMEHLRDLFTLDYYSKNRLRRVELQYIRESFYDDVLLFYMQETREKTFDVEIRKTDKSSGTEKEVPVLRSRLCFE